MRIVYDHQIFSRQRYGGVSRYIFELATRVGRFEDSNVTILAPAHMNEHLRESCSIHIAGRYLPHIPRTGKLRRGINHIVARTRLALDTPDIVHESYYSQWAVAPRKAKTVVTIYDMIHEKFPEFFRRNDRTFQKKARAVERAAHVICISETTKSDLLQHIPVHASKVSVVHLGSALTNLSARACDRLVGDPYLLFVGRRGGYKNFLGLLKAFATSDASREGIRLVCFGGGSLSTEEVSRMAELRLPRDAVMQIDGSDEVLANLYSHALAFVYSSLYEGFGMPPLEAMSFSCPVICSNTGSLPEIVGEAAEFFDPYDHASMASALDRVVSSPQRLRSLRAAGAQRVKSFSWDRCAAETHAIYRLLA